MAEIGGADAARTDIARLILGLRSAGVIDAKVLNALQQTPRDLFVPELFLSLIHI